MHRGFRSVAIWLAMALLSGMVAWYTNLFWYFYHLTLRRWESVYGRKNARIWFIIMTFSNKLMTLGI